VFSRTSKGVVNCRSSGGSTKIVSDAMSIKHGVITGQFSQIIYTHAPTTFISITDTGDQCFGCPTVRTSLSPSAGQRSSGTNRYVLERLCSYDTPLMISLSNGNRLIIRTTLSQSVFKTTDWEMYKNINVFIDKR
jgi:hypothetical protein